MRSSACAATSESGSSRATPARAAACVSPCSALPRATARSARRPRRRAIDPHEMAVALPACIIIGCYRLLIGRCTVSRCSCGARRESHTATPGCASRCRYGDGAPILAEGFRRHDSSHRCSYDKCPIGTSGTAPNCTMCTVGCAAAGLAAMGAYGHELPHAQTAPNGDCAHCGCLGVGAVHSVSGVGPALVRCWRFCDCRCRPLDRQLRGCGGDQREWNPRQLQGVPWRRAGQRHR